MADSKIQAFLFDGMVKGAVPAPSPSPPFLSLSVFLSVDDMQDSILQLVASMPSRDPLLQQRWIG